MKTVTGLINTHREAESALLDLIDSGFGRDSISIMAGEDELREFMSGTSGYPQSGWMDITPLPLEKSSLTEMGVADEDARLYVEGVKDGGFLVTVAADDARAERAANILRRHGAIDTETERHFMATYGERGERLEETYRSAYSFAESESSSHPQFRGRQWPEVEEAIHQDWEESHPGTWNKVQEAIHFGWDRTLRH